MSKLYLIPTPIGNLGDITVRALDTIKEVDSILAEDTRVTGKLLKHFDIQKPIHSHHKDNEHKCDHIVEKIANGESMALLTDAGTPGISDPGFFIVKKCIEQNVEVECLPGAVALIPALVVSGLPTDRFVFEGFLPHKKGRQSRFEALKEETKTIIFYESPHRLLKFLKEAIEHFGEERRISVSREITKKFEETVRGTIPEVLDHFENNVLKGEFVVVIEGLVKKKEKVNKYKKD